MADTSAEPAASAPPTRPAQPSFVSPTLAGPGRPFRQRIAFPPEDWPTFTSSRNVRRTVLLEFAHGGVWTLSAPLSWRWTDAALALVGEACSEAAAAGDLDPDRIAYRLADRIETTFRLELPRLDAAELSAWQPRAVVVALAASGLAGPAPGATLGAWVDATVHDAQRQLADAISAFVARLPAPLVAAASEGAALQAPRFNLLAGISPSSARNRQQFAATFPWLAASLLRSAPATAGQARWWRAIDDGVALVPYLADALQVRRETIRYLVGRVPALPDWRRRWADAAASWVRLLDALPAPLRPQDAVDWRCIEIAAEEAVAVGERMPSPGLLHAVMRERRRRELRARSGPDAATAIPKSPVVGEHPNEAVACASAQECVADASALESVAYASALESVAYATWPDELRADLRSLMPFRAALEHCLQMRAATTHRPPSPSAATPRELADSALKGRSWRRNVELARAWRAALAQCEADTAAARARMLGERFDPLLPAVRRFEGCDIVPLDTPAALAEESEAMQHCVADYAGACVSGRSLIVSVRCVESPWLRSTAEFSLERLRPGSVRLVLQQHHGAGNARPATPCAAAVRALLEAQAEPGLQAHWAALLRDRFDRDRCAPADIRRLAQAAGAEAAFRLTLRPEGTYDRMLVRWNP